LRVTSPLLQQLQTRTKLKAPFPTLHSTCLERSVRTAPSHGTSRIRSPLL
jgi:hypothetical protein